MVIKRKKNQDVSVHQTKRGDGGCNEECWDQVHRCPGEPAGPAAY